MHRRDVTGPLWLLGKNRLWGVRMKERGPVMHARDAGGLDQEGEMWGVQGMF